MTGQEKDDLVKVALETVTSLSIISTATFPGSSHAVRIDITRNQRKVIGLRLFKYLIYCKGLFNYRLVFGIQSCGVLCVGLWYSVRQTCMSIVGYIIKTGQAKNCPISNPIIPQISNYCTTAYAKMNQDKFLSGQILYKIIKLVCVAYNR